MHCPVTIWRRCPDVARDARPANLRQSSTQKAEEAGMERVDAIPQRIPTVRLTESASDVSAPCLHEHVTGYHSLALIDGTLRRAIELWPTLSPQGRHAIQAICIDAEKM